jgi:hypothetical protein
VELSAAWLVAVTVVWLIAALAFFLLYLMIWIAPNGAGDVGNYVLYDRWYDAGAILTGYVVPVAIGVLAYASGFSPWLFVLYLFPHGITVVVFGCWLRWR